ncbi:SigE family RNA polymerase sigma factor [Hamadaea tsunoensis]|uniref:SigE family RNA polymerase sigma factor n=1 Tax=Hamadaea tsunoensis TaxID=53368 RepID=UPI0003F5024F|nr:SigE family RNA polymerase sigma factor [Hamadaea tsunoensis]
MSTDPQQDYVEYLSTRWPYLRRTAFLLCGDVHRAEDVLQDTAIRLYLKWDQVRAADNMNAYVHRVLVNMCVRQYRLAWSRVLVTHRTPEREAPSADSVEERDRVTRALAALGRRQRMAVVLRYFCDLSVSEAAVVLNCSEGTVKSQTARALATLRGLLAEPSIPPGGASAQSVVKKGEFTHVRQHA